MAGAFKLPTGEYRFTQEHLSSDGGPRVYIDPSIWCIHGEHEAFDRYIVPRSNITAHLAQIHPFTVEVKGTSDELKITAPSTVGWDKEKVKSTVPIRSVVRTEEHRLNIILLLPSGTVGSVHLRRKGRNVEVLGDAEMYVLGKEIHSKRIPYDSWRCPCGAVWNSYYVAPGDVLVCNLRGGSG